MLIRKIGGLILDQHRDPDVASSSDNRYAILATRLYRRGWEYLHRPEDRHLFVVAADLAFQRCGRMLSMDLLVDLFDVACEALQTCLNYRWANCGCYYELPWANTILGTLRKGPAINFPWPHLTRLLDCLDATVREGLLTGRDLPARLSDLRGMCPTQNDPAQEKHALGFWSNPEDDFEGSEALGDTIKRLHKQTIVPGEDLPRPRSLSSDSDHSSATIFDSARLPIDVVPTRLRDRESVASVATVDYPMASPVPLGPFGRLFPPPLSNPDAAIPVESSDLAVQEVSHGQRDDEGDESTASGHLALTPTIDPLAPRDGGRRRAHTFTHVPSRLSTSIASSIPQTISETMPLVIVTSARSQPPRASLPSHLLATRELQAPPLPGAAQSSGNTVAAVVHADVTIENDDTSEHDADGTSHASSASTGNPNEGTIAP